MGLRRAYVLGPHDAATWAAAHRGGRASSEMPFGAERLREHGYAVTYSSLYSGRLGRTLERLAGRLHRRAGRPVLEPVLALLQARRPDVFVTFFEDNSHVLSRLLRAVPALRPRRAVVVVCWMSEQVRGAGARQRRRMRRALAPFDLVVAYSENQREVLGGQLGVPGERLAIVPFGVEPDAFQPDQTARPEPWALSVGGDAGRDFPTLAEAVRRSRVPCRLVAPAHRTAGLDLPDELADVGPVDFAEYVRLLRRALFVVVPSHPLAYPTGQTALLEAMSAGKACITTDTAAMRDYVRHEDTGLLVPPGDAAALAAALTRLRDDAALRQRLGAAARQEVLRRFTTRHMWQAIEDAVREQVA